MLKRFCYPGGCVGYDESTAGLFEANLGEAYRTAKLLLQSHKRVETLLPISGDALLHLDLDSLDRLDAFRVRFCDLQDALGSKVFRSILALEMEPLGSQLDVLNKMDKRGIINSFDEWKALRETRNLFAHDYPDDLNQKAEALNVAYSKLLDLVQVLDSAAAYVREKVGLTLQEFPPLVGDG